MKKLWRLVVEVTFIMVLFYANLLMGEFEHSGQGTSKGLMWAMYDIFTWSNFFIGLVAGIIGYLVFEFLRQKL